jgi:hypothetical protein
MFATAAFSTGIVARLTAKNAARMRCVIGSLHRRSGEMSGLVEPYMTFFTHGDNRGFAELDLCIHR